MPIRPWSEMFLEDRRFLEAQYSEEHRHYHNIDHPGNVYEYACHIFQEHSTRGDREFFDRHFFAHASAWHDIYYDVVRKDNEFRSSNAYLNSTCAKLSSSSLRQLVSQAILASADHCAPSNVDLPFEVRVFLDADLYELGSPYPLFDLNTQNILLEFGTQFRMQEVYEGRLAWYKSMLAKPQIFWVTKDREEQTRKNLEMGIIEMERLAFEASNPYGDFS